MSIEVGHSGTSAEPVEVVMAARLRQNGGTPGTAGNPYDMGLRRGGSQ